MKSSLSVWRKVACLAQVLLLIVSSTLATGCSKGKTEVKAKRAKTTDVQPAEPDTPPTDGLRILAYKGYIGEELVKVAEKDGMVKIVMDTFTTDEEFEKKWKDGTGGYDLVLPSHAQLSLILSNQLVAELDKKQIPNLANVDPRLLGAPYDKDNKYTIPMMFQPLVVMGVRTDKVTKPVKSLDILFDEQYRGKIGIADSGDSMVATFLMYVGQPPVVSDEAPARVKDVLTKLRPSIREFSSESLADKLKKPDGDIWIALDLFGNLGALHGSEDKNIKLVIPETGVPMWVESICVPAMAANPDLAYWFINYLLQEDISLQNAVETGLSTVNLPARAKLDASVREDAIAYPPAPARVKVLADWMYQEKEETKKIEPFWKEYKAGK